jgi:hypothetical protein
MPVAKMHGLFGAAWWVPNKACFRRWVEAAGFDVIRTGGVSFVERHGAKPSVRTPDASSRDDRHAETRRPLAVVGPVASGQVIRP